MTKKNKKKMSKKKNDLTVSQSIYIIKLHGIGGEENLNLSLLLMQSWTKILFGKISFWFTKKTAKTVRPPTWIAGIITKMSQKKDVEGNRARETQQNFS